MRKHSVAMWIIPGAAILLLILPWQTSQADTGPKPSMDFKIEYAIDPPPELVSGFMMICADHKCASPQVFGGHCADSSTPEPMMLTKPSEIYCYQRISCSSDRCTAYNTYADYYRLDFAFSDGKTRVSNVFGKVYFYAQYRITVRENDLLVEEMPGYAMPFNWLGALGYGIMFVVVAVYLGIIILLLRRILGKQDITQEREKHVVLSTGERTTYMEKTSPIRGRCIAAWVVSALFIFSCLLTSGVFGGMVLLTGLWTTLAVELALGLVYALWRKHPILLPADRHPADEHDHPAHSMADVKRHPCGLIYCSDLDR